MGFPIKLVVSEFGWSYNVKGAGILNSVTIMLVMLGALKKSNDTLLCRRDTENLHLLLGTGVNNYRRYNTYTNFGWTSVSSIYFRSSLITVVIPGSWK